MNTPRAVLQSPQISPQTSLVSRRIQVLLSSIMMMTASVNAHEDTSKTGDTYIATNNVPGEVLAQVFEGFTSQLKYDSEHDTWNIGYGTDIGKKQSHWPYGTFAEDIANHMLSTGMSRVEIRAILTGEKTITQKLAQELFDMRYEKRKNMLTQRYEELYQKKFTDLPEKVQKMLVDFSYNMRGEYGILPAPGFPGFPQACQALQEQNWAKLAHEIAESAYADQVGPRRAGYWVYQLTKLSEKPLTAMTKDVKAEVRSFKKVQPEIESKIASILREKINGEG